MAGFEWDEAKAKANLEQHGVSFDLAERFDYDTALDVEDDRRDYGEQRRIAIGHLLGEPTGRLYVLVYTRRGRARRIISVRKANSREEKRYVRDR